MRRGGLQHGLEPPGVALAPLQSVHEFASAVFERSRHGLELWVILRVSSGSSVQLDAVACGVQLSNLRDDEWMHGGELVHGEPAPALE